jgi:hypothetical protein
MNDQKENDKKPIELKIDKKVDIFDSNKDEKEKIEEENDDSDDDEKQPDDKNLKKKK